jgi:hypothetical protein
LKSNHIPLSLTLPSSPFSLPFVLKLLKTNLCWSGRLLWCRQRLWSIAVLWITSWQRVLGTRFAGSSSKESIKCRSNFFPHGSGSNLVIHQVPVAPLLAWNRFPDKQQLWSFRSSFLWNNKNQVEFLDFVLLDEMVNNKECSMVKMIWGENKHIQRSEHCNGAAALFLSSYVDTIQLRLIKQTKGSRR